MPFIENPPVKVYPEGIGKLVYVDSTTSETEPPSKWTYVRRKFIVVFLTILAIVLSWLLFFNEVIWAILGSLTAFGFGWYYFKGQRFLGRDFFIGTEGFAVYQFSGNRENVDWKNERRFDEKLLLLHREEVVFNNGYDKTNYAFMLMQEPVEGSELEIIDEDTSYHQCPDGGDNTGDPIYDFWIRVEARLTEKGVRDAKARWAAGESQPFYIMKKENDGSWKLNAVMQLFSDSLLLEGKTFTREETSLRGDDLYLQKSGEEEIYMVSLQTTGNASTLRALLKA